LILEELHVSPYPSRRKHFELHNVILLQLSVLYEQNKTRTNLQILLEFHRNVIKLTTFHDSSIQKPLPIHQKKKNNPPTHILCLTDLNTVSVILKAIPSVDIPFPKPYCSVNQHVVSMQMLA
jgi:hypothetical protein